MDPPRPMTSAEVQRVQRNILGVVAGFCEAEGIRYYLWAGSLLGAVRHGGFIPWDDDIDVSLPREDYERFCREFEHFTSDLELYTRTTRPGYLMPFAKVGDRRTRVIEASETAIPMGVNIDVYPIDGWPNRWPMRVAHDVWLRFLSWLRLFKSLQPQPEWTWRKSLILACAKFVTRAVPMSAILDALTRASTRADPDRCTHLGVTVDTPSERVPREAYGEPVRVEFEGRRFSAPSDYELVLVTLYGPGFMSVPPASEQVTHHASTAFWISEIA